MTDPVAIRAEGRRLWADYSESDETGVTRDEWERWWYFHADVLLADPVPKCQRIGGPVTLAQSLHMVQPGQEIPKLVFDVCEQVLEQFTVCVPAPAPADVLLADPAPVGLTEDDREYVERLRVSWSYQPQVVDLIAIIDRLSAAAVDDREPSVTYTSTATRRTTAVDDRERIPEGWRVEWLVEEPEGPGCGPRRIPYLDQIPAVSPSVDPEEG